MPEVRPPEKLKVFISYSRRDLAFADRLVEALKARGFDVWIDRQDLPTLEDWERELTNFIHRADTVVFVVSPHSLSSKVVRWEVEQVRVNGKRLAPVVIADIAGLEVPPDIARINYLFFTDEASFERNSDRLARALNTDVAWLKEHTRVGELARHWSERGKPADALIRGNDLDDAIAWAARRPREAPDVTAAQRAFLEASQIERIEETRRTVVQRRRRRQLQSLVAVVLVAGIAYAAWSNWQYVSFRLTALADAIWSKALTASVERELKPKDSFKECSRCPEMIVVPAGEFMMGSDVDDKDAKASEMPRHEVGITRRFAISKFEVTFDEWNACTIAGACGYQPPDLGWGGGSRPVINVSWEDTQQYVAWLSKLTGRPYRLLSEAEWEYAARAGGEQRYSWGDGIGSEHANCNGCASPWDNKQTAPIGSFEANAFGVHDMLGNVWEWVEDCWHEHYEGAPADGSPWTSACNDAGRRVVRGGGWNDVPTDLRVASRYGGPSGIRNGVNGIRLGRTLNPQPRR